MRRSVLSLPVFEPGTVWLCGAGPGDPGLLTLHAVNGLEQADVVVHDALVHHSILGLTRPGADLVHAGKRGGRPSPKQRDISAKLIELARAGKRVLRLKGGDPFTFARGAEEARALVEAGIGFRLIPGITSGIGGLAYAGVPVSDRDINQTITFVTGHSAGGHMTDTVNWRAVAEGSPVVIVYMGLKYLGEIADKFIAAGRSPDEPVAVISKATTPEQKVLETTLAAAAEEAAAAAMEAPSLIVIGEVVRLRAQLNWLEALGEAAGGRSPRHKKAAG